MMDAAVIVHRWFEQGAGWAYAPEIEEIKLDLIASLDKFLKAAKPGPFHVDLRDGACVIGNIFEDIECSDSKAKDRKPTILRAAFLRHIPSDEQSQVILERLCSLWPSCPGPDPQLVIEVANSLTARLPEPAVDLATKTTPIKKIIFGTMTLAVGCIIIGYAFAFRSSIHDPSKELTPIAVAMDAQLKSWRVDRGEELPNATINAYLLFLSQAHLGSLALRSEHPYAKFISRLPAVPDEPPNGQWTRHGIDLALANLVSHLEGRQTTGADVSRGEESVSRIGELMNYDTWRRQVRKSSEPAARFRNAPDPQVAEYVERFRRTSAVDLAPIAGLMKELVVKWGLQVDPNASPFEILRLFFTTLVRPDGLEKCSGADKGHAYWGFADRLPGLADCRGWTCDDPDQLDSALRFLHQKLNGASEGMTTEGLVEAIAREMDYEAWASRPAIPYKKEGKPDSQQLVRFVDRFRNPEAAETIFKSRAR